MPSYSQLQLYRRCPRQYEFACVKKIERPLSIGEAFGSSVHNALKKFGDLERTNQQPETSNQLTMFHERKEQSEKLSYAHLQNLWHQSFIIHSYPTRLEADFDRKRGEDLLRHFFAWWEKEPREVITIEKGFSITLSGDLTITGRFDRIEKTDLGLRIVDFKTGSLRTQDEVDADLQLSIYALACLNEFGELPAELVLLFLSEEGITERVTHRSPGALEDAKKQILAIMEQIESKDFHPMPSLEKCRHCPYRNVCDAAAVR